MKIRTTPEYKNPISKYVHEYMYWKKQQVIEGRLSNSQYENLFTERFSVDKDFYSGKRILDIGCGPRGSLEWADNAAQRVGLDPLAEAYEFIIQGSHEMEYVPDFAEKISFENDHFDIVTSINSLDHVDDLGVVIGEMKRVVKPGGHIFIAAEICKDKKPCEPSPVNWDLAELFEDEFEVMDTFCFSFYKGVNRSIQQGEIYDHDNPQTETGVLRLRLVKKQDC
ncbi:MAG: class I SAM-dependent methyltransferase [Pseudodesulfovibrio sp.]|nr:class I SAM-dependent methyltransferase [Pseudodesulfovibrio sp.]